MEPDAEEFQKSITVELQEIKNRVRNLIGDANWGEEGRFKEAILRNTIKRFLGSKFSIGAGFIVKTPLYSFNHELDVSKQIDIIVYDNTYPVLFSEGDFVITTPESVKAIVEVKTSVSEPWETIVRKATSNGILIEKDIFNGIFIFEGEGTIPRFDSLERCLKREYRNTRDKMEKCCVDHIAIGGDYFIKLWKEGANVDNDDCEHDFYRVYKLRDLSFSYFISNLVDSLHKEEVSDRQWFLFPIKGTKESHRGEIICL